MVPSRPSPVRKPTSRAAPPDPPQASPTGPSRGASQAASQAASHGSAHASASHASSGSHAFPAAHAAAQPAHATPNATPGARAARIPREAAGTTDRWARMNLVAGATLVVAGLLVDTVGFAREDFVAAGGALVVVAGLAGILIVLVKGMPPRANLLGAIAIALGVLLTIHDVAFGPLATTAHAALGALMVVFGVLQVLGRSRLVSLLGQAQAS